MDGVLAQIRGTLLDSHRRVQGSTGKVNCIWSLVRLVNLKDSKKHY